MDLSPGMHIHNFTITDVEELAEIDGTAYLMRHDTCGARLLYLKNDDIDKAFAIGFRTPPEDDTGVFHILEHSVLCGSRKFPVKEPFVNLLKTSMQTFLNAMTFPDKTLYPVASTNENDLLNLMDVYMDAVLYPRIYDTDLIFKQEGWHYESTTGGAAGNSNDTQRRLVLNGVVYNEMKGALSDPPSVLGDEVMRALFPDTPYASESGGAPEAIPTLTYESYLANHAAHYRLDNSYIILYGDLDIDRFLAFLDDGYLTPTGPGIGPGPRELPLQKPVIDLGRSITMPTAPENACASLAYVIGTARDREKVLATSILFDVLLGSNEAPLKRALLDADLASDIRGGVLDSVLQPFVSIDLRSMNDGAFERFKDTVDASLERILADGIEPELIDASLSHAEFIMAERNFGTSEGVILAMTALSGWLYDDAMATSYIRYEDAFADLRSKIGTSYFEDLARDVFLQNDHMASVQLIPVTDDDNAEAVRLDAIAATFDDIDWQAIEGDLAALREAQETPDAPEAIALLPQLHVCDIQDAPKPCEWQLDTSHSIPCIRSDVSTRGIVYVNRYFDINHLAFEDLPYLSLMAGMLGNLDTKQHTAAQLDVMMQAKLGNLSFALGAGTAEDDIDRVYLHLVVSSSALSKNIDQLTAISHEVMTETLFTDKAKMHDILEQGRVSIERSMMNAGNRAATARARSYLYRSDQVTDMATGIGFYFFLKDLLANYDARFDELSAKLAALARMVFTDDGQLIGFGGDDEAFDTFWATLPALGPCEKDTRMQIPDPVDLHEAFAMPGNVTFTAAVYDRRFLDNQTDTCSRGAWEVISRIVGLDYLWTEVRVKGGAYGTGMSATSVGPMMLSSFRDPHINQTLAAFKGIAPWLASFDPTQDELEGYIVSSVAGIDRPQKPRALVCKNDIAYITGRKKDYETMIRQQILDVTADEIRAAAPVMEKVMAKAVTCTFGSADIIEAENTDYTIVKPFGDGGR